MANVPSLDPAENYGAEVCLRFPSRQSFLFHAQRGCLTGVTILGVQKIRWDLGPEDCHKYQGTFLLSLISRNR